jgi:hypothetical protein
LNGNIAVNLNGGYFKIDIVKTAAQTGSGQLVPGKYTTLYGWLWTELTDAGIDRRRQQSDNRYIDL